MSDSSVPDLLVETPVSDDDPCGPDLRWDARFMALEPDLEALLSADEDAPPIVGAQSARAAPVASDLVARAEAVTAGTRHVQAIAVLAQARWMAQGVEAYAHTMEALLAASERWSDPATGIHPRADPDDGDLSERTGAFVWALRNIPRLVAITGWGASAAPDARSRAALALEGVFSRWASRLEPALGPGHGADARAAYAVLSKLSGFSLALESAGPAPEAPADVSAPAPAAAPAVEDAWLLLERATERMTQQHPHSPAVLVMRMLLAWRELDLAEISAVSTKAFDKMTLDQIASWAKAQVAPSD